MKRAILVWEIGAGLGHVTKLRIAAEALAQFGIECTAAVLPRFDHAALLAPLAGQVRHAPLLPWFGSTRAVRGLPTWPATYGDLLGDYGLFCADIARRQIETWRTIYDEERPDIIIGDQAPLALLAGRTLGIATVAIGNGFTLPPPQLTSFPPFLSWNPIANWMEEQMVDAINAATAAFSGPTLQRLPQIYDCDLVLRCCIDILDPYLGVDDLRRLPTVMPPLEMVDGPKDEVFVYISAADRYDPVVLAAAMSLSLPARIYIQDADPALRSMFRARGIAVEDRPVPPTEIVRRSRVAFHAANSGIAALCMRAGLPFVAEPRHEEQEFNASRAVAENVCIAVSSRDRTVPRLHEAILELYESRSAKVRAMALGERLASQFLQHPRDAIAERIAALVN